MKLLLDVSGFLKLYSEGVFQMVTVHYSKGSVKTEKCDKFIFFLIYDFGHTKSIHRDRCERVRTSYSLNTPRLFDGVCRRSNPEPIYETVNFFYTKTVHYRVENLKIIFMTFYAWYIVIVFEQNFYSSNSNSVYIAAIRMMPAIARASLVVLA